MYVCYHLNKTLIIFLGTEEMVHLQLKIEKTQKPEKISMLTLDTSTFSYTHYINMICEMLMRGGGGGGGGGLITGRH